MTRHATQDNIGGGARWRDVKEEEEDVEDVEEEESSDTTCSGPL